MPRNNAPHRAAALPAGLLATLLALLALSACGSPDPDAPVALQGTDLSQADLEQEISSRYEPDDPKDTLTAVCEGALTAEADATQDCLVTTGGKKVGVRAWTTDVEADDLGIETTVFLPPEMVADAIGSALEMQGYEKVDSTCHGDLVGKVGDAVVCTVTTPQGETEVNVDVTSVDGLLINFDFKSA
ncbi:MAG: DUF4333 domain-containing protein [Nocardioides sp.]